MRHGFLLVLLTFIVPAQKVEMVSKIEVVSKERAMKRLVSGTEVQCPALHQVTAEINIVVLVSVNQKGIVHVISFKDKVHPAFRHEIKKALEKWRFPPGDHNWTVNIWIKKKC